MLAGISSVDNVSLRGRRRKRVTVKEDREGRTHGQKKVPKSSKEKKTYWPQTAVNTVCHECRKQEGLVGIWRVAGNTWHHNLVVRGNFCFKGIFCLGGILCSSRQQVDGKAQQNVHEEKLMSALDKFVIMARMWSSPCCFNWFRVCSVCTFQECPREPGCQE